jgi:methyl coenzyme M reductase subunit D
VKIRPKSKGKDIIAVGDQNIEFSSDYGKTWKTISQEKMQSLGKVTKFIRESEMNYFEQLNVSAGHYGKNGQAIIAEVWSKLRCIASNY